MANDRDESPLEGSEKRDTLSHASKHELNQLLSNLQFQYQQNTRQHLYTTYILRKVLHHNGNKMVQLPKRISFWPRKVTADILKAKMAYDYVSEEDDLRVVSSENNVDDNGQNDDTNLLMDLEIEARIKSKLFQKLRERNSDLDEEEFLDFYENKVLPRKDVLVRTIENKFDDVLRSMNYEFVSSKKRAIKYKDVLNHCLSIYEEDRHSDKYIHFVQKCEKLFFKQGLNAEFVDSRFKLHGDIIVSDDESTQEEGDSDN